MTRGTLVLLNPDKMFVAQEINGDMYLHFEGQTDRDGELYKCDSKGARAYKGLEKVETKKDLKELLNNLDMYKEDFLDQKDNEDFELIYTIEDKEEIKERLNFNHYNKQVECEREDGSKHEISWYFYYWFSDYVFIKNNTGKELVLIDKTHKIKTIQDKDIIVLRFGTFYKV